MRKPPKPPQRIEAKRPRRTRRYVSLKEMVLLSDLPVEVRIRQASAPLYLRRYE